MARIYHHWEKWECCKAGFYDTSPPPGMTADDALLAYADFLRDIPLFESVLSRVVSEWVVSCEQFLSNDSINRIAWLGQASMCFHASIPACFRAGFKLLSDKEQRLANQAAAKWLRIWQSRQGGEFALCNDLIVKKVRHDESLISGRISAYIERWKHRGYSTGIPDEVPPGLMHNGLAPSYRAVAIALLKNDLKLTSLGFSAPYSDWYGVLKRIEIQARPTTSNQMEFAI